MLPCCLLVAHVTVYTVYDVFSLGILHDEDTVRAVSTSGRRTELFAGPFEYGCVFIVLTMLAWRRTGVYCPTLTLCIQSHPRFSIRQLC